MRMGLTRVAIGVMALCSLACADRNRTEKIDPRYNGIAALATGGEFLFVGSSKRLLYRLKAGSSTLEQVTSLPAMQSNLRLMAAGSHVYLFDHTRFFHSADHGDTWVELAYPTDHVGGFLGVGVGRAGDAAVTFVDGIWIYKPDEPATFVEVPALHVSAVCFMGDEIVFKTSTAIEVRNIADGAAVRSLPHAARVTEAGDCGERLYFTASGRLYSYQAGQAAATAVAPLLDVHTTQRMHEMADGRLVLIGLDDVKIIRPESGEVEEAFAVRYPFSAAFDGRLFLGGRDAFLIKQKGLPDQVLHLPSP